MIHDWPKCWGSDEEEDDSEGAEQISITTTNRRPHDQMLTDAQVLGAGLGMAPVLPV
jgi:hypothetical protein